LVNDSPVYFALETAGKLEFCELWEWKRRERVGFAIGIATREFLNSAPALQDRRRSQDKSVTIASAFATIAAVASISPIASAATTTAVAAATISTTAAPTTAEAASRALRTIFARASFIDGEIAPAEWFAVQSLDRLLRVIVIFHGHKTKAARTAGHAIHDHVDLLDRAISGE
jgi:hypothetical protein